MAGALAGCLSDGTAGDTSTDGDDTATGTATDTASATGTPTPSAAGVASENWVPASVAEGSGVARFATLRPAALAPHADALGTEYYETLSSGGHVGEVTGLGGADLSTIVRSGRIGVLVAAFDPDAVASSLREAGFERTGTHEGFRLWTGAPGDAPEQVVAVGEGVVVGPAASNYPVSTGDATAFVDAGLGTGDRLVAASEPAGTAVERLSDGQFRTVLLREPPTETDAERGRFAGNTSLSYRLAVDGADTEMRIVLLFASEGDADPDAVRTWIEGAGGGVLDRLDDVAVGQDGAAVSVTGTLGTGELSKTSLGTVFGAEGRDVQQNVQAGVSLAVDDEADTIRATWQSSQNAEYVTVRFAPRTGEAVTERIEEVGNAVTYEGEDGQTVDVRALAHAGEQSTVILEDTFEL